MNGDRLRPAGGDVLGIAAVDLFAGALLAVFVMFVIYIWLHQDPVSECFVKFRDHASAVYEEKQEAFFARPKFTFLRTQLILNDSWLSFEPCLWELPEAKQEQLRQLFGQLVSEDFRSCIESVQIEGHADTKQFLAASCSRAHPTRAREFSRIGPWADNTQLSQNRARAVFDALRKLPFVTDMWTQHKIHIGGYGDSWPLVEDQASALNRRVELHVKFYEDQSRTTSRSDESAEAVNSLLPR